MRLRMTGKEGVLRAIELILLYNLVEVLSFLFADGFFEFQNSEFKRAAAETEFYNVARFKIVRRFYVFAVYADSAAVAGVVCHSAAF